MATYLGLFGFLLVIAVLIAIVVYFIPVNLFLEARSSGVYVGLVDMAQMSIKRIPHHTIIKALITLQKSGLNNITLEELQNHYQAGGNVPLVAGALVAASKANLGLDFKGAARIDLAGRNVLEAVQTSVSPKVINTNEFKALPQDGIQVIVRAKITVRTNIDAVIGGATEDTIIARVNEGIISEIGKVASHQKVLEDPVAIADAVEVAGLDIGTAFKIMSIDIVDMNIGKNVGVEVKMEQANADKNIAQAEAEKRRSMAIAEEQEMKAKAEKARATLLDAESKIPIAIAEAFRSGNLSIMDFYQYRNIKADTEMREALSKTTQEPTTRIDETIEEMEDKNK